MSTPTDAQLVQQAEAALKSTTVSYGQWAKNIEKGVYNPPDGSKTQWGIAFAALAEITGVTPPPPPPPPPPAGVSGVGLYALGNGPEGFQHLTDGTYDLIIGPPGSGPFLATLPKTIERYVYTVVAGTPGAVSPEYVLLDPSDPAAFMPQALQLVPAGSGVGIFVDNALLEIPGLTSAIQTIGAQFKTQGLPFGINLGSYLSGDDDSDDGQLWIQRVAEVGPYTTACMLENWAQFSGGSNQGQPRTNSNGGNLSSWMECPAAAAKAGTRIVAVTYGGEPNLTYGRAALLLSPGVASSAVFATGADTNADPYDSTWTKANPNPVLNADGTASL